MDKSKYKHLTTYITLADASLIVIGSYEYGLQVCVKQYKRAFANRVITQYLTKVETSEENIDILINQMDYSTERIPQMIVGNTIVDCTRLTIHFNL